jgi:flavin-dependent dehydrogenase
MRRSSGTAIVIGSGIAGLATARVLADRFARVIVVERDVTPNAAVSRPGVPQGAHPHTLLVAGQRVLEELFDGLEKELVAEGACVFESGTNLLFYRFGQLWPRVSTGVQMLTVSRPALEYAMRQRVAALPGVQVRAGSPVSGLVAEGDRISGVVLADGEELRSDLVVDCSGRGTRSDRWLAAHGFPSPPIVEVKIGVGYASRFLRRGPNDLPGSTGLYIMATPPDEKRIGVALPVEGDRWLVGLGGWHGGGPTGDPDDFAAFARSLPHPAVADLLDRAEPLTDVEVQQFPSSRPRDSSRSATRSRRSTRSTGKE